ncbi:MAG TPA: lipocalin family protein [Pyrinomonadaceae bacterium]|nr:lipocalin family protein [Pyrinomonadaceae bacterium]HMP65648.1 lipocalin family protein [Pyrinomonadaceae bacterium]
MPPFFVFKSTYLTISKTYIEIDLGAMYRDIINGTQILFEEAFETLADRVAGAARPLRNGTEHEPVRLPRDLYAHRDVQTEWWYYTGHIETAGARQFGFELVFFKRRTDLDKFAVVPLRLIGNPYYFAHFALTDVDKLNFRYSHRKSSNGLLDLPASASEDHYHVRLGDWSVREAHGSHILRATLDDGTVFEASLTPSKPSILNGEQGVSFKDRGEASRYFSYTRMAVDGVLTAGGSSEKFTGSAWMDREFGTWEPTENQKGWDWFSIQLANGSDLMCYHIRNNRGETSPYSSGTFVDADGNYRRLAREDFLIEPLETWKSPRTEAEYPSLWKVKVPSLGLDLTVSPVMRDQELDTRGTTMIIYWEGACRVSGKAYGEDMIGKAYVELVGYDRSHESPNLAYFLLGDPLRFISAK